VGTGVAIRVDPAASEGVVSVTSATTTEAIQLFYLMVLLSGDKQHRNEAQRLCSPLQQNCYTASLCRSN